MALWEGINDEYAEIRDLDKIKKMAANIRTAVLNAR